MQILDSLTKLPDIARLLKSVKSIAVVGLSPKEGRPSNIVARYLMENGYVIYPVNPGQTRILDEVCYPEITAIPHRIEIVNIFRRSEDVLPIVEKAMTLRPLPKNIWMQQGIVNKDAAELAKSHGVSVIMDRCIKIDHSNLLGQ